MGLFTKDKNIKRKFEHALDEKYQGILDDLKNNADSDYSFNLRSYTKVKDTKLFDEDYYVSQYDVPISRKYALLHYLDEGFKEHMNPIEYFDGNRYLEMNPKVKEADMNPLVHYEIFGRKEGREFPLPIEWDEKTRKKQLDVKYEDILEDLENNNVEKYSSNLKSYDKIKDSENFDADYYITQYDVPISREYALLHYLEEGFKESKNPSAEFDGNKYLKMYEDVAKANINPLVHYELYGKEEGREFPFSKDAELNNRLDNLESMIYSNRMVENLNLLRDKVSKGEEINVVFVLPAMMFVYKQLYKLFSEDDMFNVKIVLVPHRIGSKKTINDVAKDKYYQIYGYLLDQGYDVIEGYDFESNEGIDLEMECNPDILFYVMPYMRIYPDNMKIENLPSNILYAYIPYGEFLESDLEDNLYNFGWNERIWKIFCSTKDYYVNSSRKSKVGSSNVVISGSARMDSLINYTPSEDDYQWIYPKEENKKRIIWAPHHTLSRPNMDELVSYSTFDQNYEFFYNYAKEHPEIEWVLRPHPLLKEILTSVDTYMKLKGIIDDDFVDDYFFKWNSLPNARVHEELDYVDLFATADAMITDCVSFKAEYLYANKPGLILKKDDIEYDGYKGLVNESWYIANGSDFDKIKEFIEDVVVNEHDYLKEKREKVFKDKFDYNTGHASEAIFNYIKNKLS